MKFYKPCKSKIDKALKWIKTNQRDPWGISPFRQRKLKLESVAELFKIFYPKKDWAFRFKDFEYLSEEIPYLKFYVPHGYKLFMTCIEEAAHPMVEKYLLPIDKLPNE